MNITKKISHCELNFPFYGKTIGPQISTWKFWGGILQCTVPVMVLAFRMRLQPNLPTGCNRDSHLNNGWGMYARKPRSNSLCFNQTTLKSVQLQREPWTIPKVLFTLQGLQWQMCHQHSGCPQTLQVHDFGVNLSRSCLISYDVYTYLYYMFIKIYNIYSIYV